MANARFIKENEIKTILKLYNDHRLSLSKISNICKCDPSSIKRVLLANNVEIRDQKFTSNKHYVDESYFKIINSESKAYWLGFLYADGIICDKYIGIKLAIKDYSHLIKFSSSLNATQKIKQIINNSGFGKGNVSCSITISNKILVNDLINLGCIKNKSKILKFPNENILPENLIRHFIRGYFDGDGSVYYTINKKFNYICPSISFTGTENMLINIKRYLIPKSKSNIYKYKNKDIYDLKIGGKNFINEIYEYFYNNATIFLDRKKEKFIEIFELQQSRNNL